MKTSVISQAVISALLVSVATVANAAVMLNIDSAVKESRDAEAIVKLVIVADDASGNSVGAANISATDNKNQAKPSATSHFSFVETNVDDANTVVISNALASAFSTTVGGEAGGVSIHNASMKSIKNAPYRAEVVSEEVQTLNDGNQIIKRNVQLSYRDSAGRTRTEINDANGNTRSIAIYDAVEKTTYSLNPKLKVATKIKADPDFQKRIDQLREKAKENSRDGKSTSIGHREILVSRIERGGDADGKSVIEEIRVNSVPVADGEHLSGKRPAEIRINTSSTNGAALGGLNANLIGLGSLSTSFADRAWAAKATTKQLGTKDIDGIRAEGKLRAYTIPAGEVGNKNPITVSTETWVSPELQITLYSKHSDPRAGEKIYRLQNIKRGEQALDLFGVPEGYQLKDMPMMRFDVKTK